METDPIDGFEKNNRKGKYHRSTILVARLSASFLGMSISMIASGEKFETAIHEKPGAVGSGEQNVAWPGIKPKKRAGINGET